MARTVDSDHAIVFWSSARVQRAVAEAAFAKVGKENLLPKPDHFNALKAAALEVAGAHNVYDDGPIKPYGLSGHGNGVGCEVRRFVRGTTRNELPFLFSLGAMRQSDGSYSIELLDVDAAACPQIAKHKAKVEMQADQYWRQQCEFLSANDLTQAITGLVKDSCGFLLRDEGVVWSLPLDSVGDYETVADQLARQGVSMVVCICPPKVNTRLVQHMSEELVKRSLSVFDGIIDDVDDLRDRGGKPRSNGQQSRLEQWISAEETLQKNRSLLGKAFAHVSKAARLAREKIGEVALEAFA